MLFGGARGVACLLPRPQQAVHSPAERVGALLVCHMPVRSSIHDGRYKQEQTERLQLETTHARLQADREQAHAQVG